MREKKVFYFHKSTFWSFSYKLWPGPLPTVPQRMLCPRGCCAPVSLVRVYSVTLSLHDLVYLFLQGRSSKELSKGISVWWPVAISSHHFPRPAMKEQVVFNIFTTFLLIRRISFFTDMFGVCYWIMFLLLHETTCLLYLRELPTEFINHLHFRKIKILTGPHDICEKQCLWLNTKGSSRRNAKDIIQRNNIFSLLHFMSHSEW